MIIFVSKISFFFFILMELSVEKYAFHFYARKILLPKVMSLSWFAQQGFQFQDHLVYQGLQQFFTLKGPYDDVMKAFYYKIITLILLIYILIYYIKLFILILCFKQIIS